MTTQKRTPDRPTPQSFDAATLFALTLRPDIHYTDLVGVEDTAMVEEAIKRISLRHRWPCAWLRASDGYVAMRGLRDSTADDTRAVCWEMMQATPGYIDAVLNGMRPRLTKFLDAAVKDADRDAAAQARKLAEVSLAMERHLPTSCAIVAAA